MSGFIVCFCCYWEQIKTKGIPLECPGRGASCLEMARPELCARRTPSSDLGGAEHAHVIPHVSLFQHLYRVRSRVFSIARGHKIAIDGRCAPVVPPTHGPLAGFPKC